MGLFPKNMLLGKRNDETKIEPMEEANNVHISDAVSRSVSIQGCLKCICSKVNLNKTLLMLHLSSVAI